MITDVPGIRVGHVTDPVGLTGCTVVLTDRPAVGGVELRGWAVAVHGLDFLDPRHLVPTLNGVLLTGGSAFGLEAVFGVMQYLEERGVGFSAGPTVVPHVAGAVLFDLAVGDPRARPTRAMGYQAAVAARPGPLAEGNVGAGTGATGGSGRGPRRGGRPPELHPPAHHDRGGGDQRPPQQARGDQGGAARDARLRPGPLPAPYGGGRGHPLLPLRGGRPRRPHPPGAGCGRGRGPRHRPGRPGRRLPPRPPRGPRALKFFTCRASPVGLGWGSVRGQLPFAM